MASNLDVIDSEDSVRAVHSFRVCSRRLREPLSVCRDALDIPIPKAIRSRTKSARNALSKVRDIDVLSDSIRGSDATSSFAESDEGQALLTLLAEQRVKGQRRAVRDLAELNAAGLIKRLKELSQQLLNVGNNADARVLEDVSARWHRYELKLTRIDTSPGSEINWHDVRLDLKRLRYLTELMLELKGLSNEALLRHFKKMQDGLGSYSDHVFAAREIFRLAADETHLYRRPEWSKAVMTYALHRMDLALRLRDDMRVGWHAFMGELHELSVPLDA
ncbi:MAG: CHAD domain-containing protein [Planctomycetota bacterium]